MRIPIFLKTSNRRPAHNTCSLTLRISNVNNSSKNWLNQYHTEVKDRFASTDGLNQDELRYLRDKTQEIIY
jgi:hypothetical protein